MNEKLKKTKQNEEFNTKEILELKTTLISMKESLDSLKQELQSFQRRQSSGLSSTELNKQDKIQSQKDAATMLPNFIPGQSGFLKDHSDSKESSSTPSSPQDLLAKAEVEIEGDKFNNAFNTLKDFESKFPNFHPKDKYQYLLAKTQFGLKNYEKSLESLKVLFLDYPESEMTLDGKFLEAKTLENTHSISKAIDIYKYIIQNTQNKHAVQNARLSIKRLQASQK